VKSQAARVAWYRFRVSFDGRWGGYLTVVVLVGLLGGLAMGSVAAARRTQSSFTVYLASTDPSDLQFGSAVYNPAAGYNSGYDAAVIQDVARLPHVRRVESDVNLWGLELAPVRRHPNAPHSVDATGSVDGEYFNLDRLTVVQGRMANPQRANEFVLTAQGATYLHLHVGDVITEGFFTNAEVDAVESGQPLGPPYKRIKVKLVGIVVYNDTIVQDGVDIQQAGPPSALFTPALTRQLLACCVSSTGSALQVTKGSSVATVESELDRYISRSPQLSKLAGGALSFTATSTLAPKADRAIKPESIALGAFGGIVGLAALLIAGQIIGRQLRLGADEEATLRALGASPVMTAADGLAGLLGAVVIGALLAVGVAVGLSPIAPFGPARAVDPTPGVAFDWTVLGLGFAGLVVLLSALAVAISVRNAPHRLAERRQRTVGRGSTLARSVGTTGLPAPAVTGIRFALEPGAGRNSVPVRSAILGAALAIVVVLATVTFGASLDTLVSHPRLYGWNWSYELTGGGGVGDIPGQQAKILLDDDASVAAWSGIYFGSAIIDGQNVPVMLGSPHASVGPPILAGHAFDASNQVVLGSVTLAQLHQKIGDTVEVNLGNGHSTRLRIVGTATLPTIGQGGSAHLEMGTGAVGSYTFESATARNIFDNSPAGPNNILVRFRAGANPVVALASLKRIADKLSLPTNYGVAVAGVERPAEIIDYRSLGRTPAYLGAGLAAGAVVALGLTLVASVRRRRRDLALLKTLGFTGRQLAAIVAWQSSVAVGIGTVVGVPLGIVLGRILWDLFANEINVVPDPSVPVVFVLLIALGALVLANLVAAIPGRIAARTPTALLLRAE
jgi:hypothetical protein